MGKSAASHAGGSSTIRARPTRQRGSRNGSCTRAKALGPPRTPSAKKTAAKKPVQCIKAFVVTGGFLKQGHVCSTVDFKGEHFVKTCVSENWLCKAASGKCRALAPLARSKVIGDLRGLLAEAKLAADIEQGAEAKAFAPAKLPVRRDAMADLGLDGGASGPGSDHVMYGLGLDDGMSDLGLDGPGSERSPCKSSAPAGSRSRLGVSKLLMGQKARKAAARQAHPACVVKVKLPAGLQSGDVSSVRMLTRPIGGAALRTGVYLAVESIPWLVNHMMSEVAGGGVDFTPEKSSLATPHFSFRDSAWVASAKSPSGLRERRYFTISAVVELQDGRRRPATPSELQCRKDAAFAEAEEWQLNFGAGI